MQSRYCARKLISPDPSAAPEKFVAWLRDLAAKWPSAVIVPLTDVSLPLCIRAIESGAMLKTALPDRDSYETAIDKFALAARAIEAGLKVPGTVAISRESLSSLENLRFGWPVVVKPRRSATETEQGMLRRGVSYASSRIDLLTQVQATLVDDHDEVLVQQCIAGYGMGVFALYDRGVPQFFFSHRRLRERPPTGGVSVLSESRPLPDEVMDAVRRLLGQLNWHGVAMVEFKVDAGGCAWLMEINARLWGSVQLAVDCGADFPWFSYQLARAERPAVPKQYLVNRQLRWLLGDLDRLYLILRSRRYRMTEKARACAEFLLPWWPNLRYEIFRLDDMRPAWAAAHRYWQDLRS